MGPHPCIIEAKGNMATLYTNEGPCSFIRNVIERMKEEVVEEYYVFLFIP